MGKDFLPRGSGILSLLKTSLVLTVTFILFVYIDPFICLLSIYIAEELKIRCTCTVQELLPGDLLCYSFISLMKEENMQNSCTSQESGLLTLVFYIVYKMFLLDL